MVYGRGRVQIEMENGRGREDGIWERETLMEWKMGWGDEDGICEGGDLNRDEKWEGEVKTVYGRVETQIEMRNGRER